MAKSLEFFIVMLGAVTASALSNPAAGKPWHWKSRMPLVTPIGPPKPPRIVGGKEATPHSWPHQVALFIDSRYFCCGSLISNEWVLTAAHCMDDVSSVHVVMGAHNIRKNEDTQVTMKSTNFFTHENWDLDGFKNDIALIKLPSPVTFDANIKPVSLPRTDVSVGTVVTPTGWGRTSDSTNASAASDVLRQVDVPIMSNADCASAYLFITNGHICTDTTGGKGTCHGDSGGPLNKNGKTYGITSFGSSAGCEAGYPAVFTRVTKYLRWIEKKTGVTP